MKREALLEAKEEAMKAKNDFDREKKEQRQKEERRKYEHKYYCVLVLGDKLQYVLLEHHHRVVKRQMYYHRGQDALSEQHGAGHDSSREKVYHKAFGIEFYK